WWPATTPDSVADCSIGRLAQYRITDAASQPDPRGFLAHLAATYHPGDTDFAWTRLTLWRAQLAAVLDQPPCESITAIEVHGASDSPSTALLAACLHTHLEVPAQQYLSAPSGSNAGLHEVRLERASGIITLLRTQPSIVTLTQPG